MLASTALTDLKSSADEIRRHHEAAHAAARNAIAHALAAGRLLAEVKGALPHGAFEDWLSANCAFSSRTARRYMRLHEHRDALPPGAGVKAAIEHLKTDTVSETDDPSNVPAWLPALGKAVIHGSLMESCWMVWPIEGGYASVAAWVVDKADPEMTDTIFTKRPIRSDYISEQLAAMQLADPDAARWREIPLSIALKFDAIVRDTTVVPA
jgi:hypothetical protein